ncbi:hypothetical protein ABPG74_011256 [Tetrahymena malaccensis]
MTTTRNFYDFFCYSERKAKNKSQSFSFQQNVFNNILKETFQLEIAIYYKALMKLDTNDNAIFYKNTFYFFLARRNFKQIKREVYQQVNNYIKIKKFNYNQLIFCMIKCSKNFLA